MELVQITSKVSKFQPGMKNSELGYIPSDWKVVNLRDHCFKIGSGITPNGGQKVYRSHGRPFVRSQNVGWGKLLLSDLAFIDEKTHASFRGTELQMNDVLLNITGASIGRSVVVDKSIVGGNVNQHVCVIRLNNSDLNCFFLNAFLLSNQGQRQINSFQAGGNRQGLNFDQIGKILIPIPASTKEQNSIATTLSDADALIDSLEQLIEKKKKIRDGMTQELLRPKNDWRTTSIGNLVKIRHGKSQLEVERTDGTFPILATSGLIGRANNFLYNKPSVLIGRKGTINKPQYVEYPFWAIDTIFYTEILEEHVPKFIYYLFKLINWSSYNEASGVPSLNARTIENIEVSIPRRKDQQSITDILSECDDEIAKMKARLTKMQLLKTAMMQQLLTGQIRLC